MGRDETSDLVTIYFDHLIHETDGAYKLSVDGEDVWIPRACCRNFDETGGTVDVFEDMAFDKGLI